MSANPSGAEYVNEFLTKLGRVMPGFKAIEASVWVVTLIDSGTELSPEQAAAIFADEYGSPPTTFRPAKPVPSAREQWCAEFARYVVLDGPRDVPVKLARSTSETEWASNSHMDPIEAARAWFARRGDSSRGW